jgi:uncharacterized membrane-anchored protein
MKSMINKLSLTALLFAAATAWAAPEPKAELDEAAISNKVEKFLSGIEYKKGHIEIGKGLATLDIPEAFSFVGPEQAAKILLLWGNPPDDNPPLGMIFPAGKTARDENTWAVIIEWSEDGYVKDDDAESIDYGKLLKDMKAGVSEASKERVKDGYPSLELVGWATPPRYDKATHKMYWAKEIKFGGESENTLNYNIRILGRKGVLVLNAVANMKQLKEIEAATPKLLSLVEFKEGQRYADFNPNSDHYAAYGLAALVAGGVAAKAGLFKGLLLAIFAAKKFVIIGAVAIFAAIKKLFTRNKAG